MSFLSVLKKIGTTALGIEHSIAPVLRLIPGVGSVVAVVDDLVTKVQTAIVTVEHSIPDGGGPLKLDAVTKDFEATLDLTKSILALRGETVEYDKVEFQAAVADQVSFFNRMAKVKGSFKVVPLPK